jgi:hypothetical protein
MTPCLEHERPAVIELKARVGHRRLVIPANGGTHNSGLRRRVGPGLRRDEVLAIAYPSGNPKGNYNRRRTQRATVNRRTSLNVSPTTRTT